MDIVCHLDGFVVARGRCLLKILSIMKASGETFGRIITFTMEKILGDFQMAARAAVLDLQSSLDWSGLRVMFFSLNQARSSSSSSNPSSLATNDTDMEGR